MDDVDDVEWRDIPGWENLYRISSDGRVLSLRRQVRWGAQTITIGPRILKAAPRRSGIGHVALCGNGLHKSMTIPALMRLAGFWAF
jgi:hypothetical protein